MKTIEKHSLDEKKHFATELKKFAATLAERISEDNQWTVRGFIDIFRNIYSISTDTKIISKVLEIHLFPSFLLFAREVGYRIELAKYQNWYPDMTFISEKDPKVKFAVDLKTTYRDEKNPEFCNGFTLGSHGKYFIERASLKNIQYPYNEYSGHFCLGIIYSRAMLKIDETKKFSIDEVDTIPVVASDFLFFAEEKWKIASDKVGSGNTANIGSISKIEDIVLGNGVFSNAGEEYFDDYWVNYGKIQIQNKKGEYIKMTSFKDYLKYKGLDEKLNNPKAGKARNKRV